MLKNILISLILSFLLIACGGEKNKNSSELIRAQSQGLLKNHEAIFVEFKEAIVDFDEMSIDAKINSKNSKILLTKASDSRFLLDLTYLEANQNYKIEFIYKNIPIVLEFQTGWIENFTYIAQLEQDEEKAYLHLNYSFGSTYNWQFKDKTQEGLKITLDGKDLAFSLGEFSLDTDDIKLLDRPQELVLTYDEKIMGFKEAKVLQFQIPSKPKNNDFRLISAEEKDQIATLKFSKELAENQAFQDFIQISPELNFRAWSIGKELKISANFEPGEKYKVKIAKGLKSNQGLINQGEEANITLQKDLDPSLVFANDGVFLPSGAEYQVYIKSRNVKKIHLKVSQIFANNISEYLRYKNLVGKKDDSTQEAFYSSDGFNYVAKNVIDKKIELKNQKNTWINTALDLSDLKGKSGIFSVSLSVDANDLDYKGENVYRIINKASVSKNLIFSNIALSAQNLNKQLVVHARDFSKNEALENVKIELVSKQNQILQSQNTNSNGDVKFQIQEDDEILYILASKENQISVLRFSNPLSTDGYDVEGDQNHEMIKAFIYTDRGVYRAGDSVHLSVVARENTNPLKHPISFTLINPKNQKIIENQILKSQNDIYYTQIHLDKNAINGLYRAIFNIAGVEFSKDILVQSVVPNRIKVELNADENRSLDDGNLNYELSSKYLFGALASNLKYQSFVYFSPKNYHNSKYKDYIFTNPSSLIISASADDKGNLDEKGRVQSSVEIPENILNSQGYNFNARIVSEVFEKGGRSVKAVKDVNLNRYDYFVGMKTLANSYVSEGETIDFYAIVSDLKEKLVSGKTLEYRIYQNDYYWWWDYDSYDEFLRSIKQDTNTKLIEKGELTSSSEPMKFSFNTSNYYGQMFIELIDKESEVSTGQSFYVSSWGEPSYADVVSSLKIKSDKNKYKIGQSAKIEFESVAGAKALITLSSNSKIIDRFVMDTQDKSTSIELAMKKEYAPNIYVSVSLFQDYNKIDNDRALRLFGVIPLYVEDENTKLDLELKTPDKILPNSNFEIEIQSKDKRAFNYTVAIVDEGLLDLTDFKTPDIWKGFYAKTGFTLKTYDTYSQIIPKFTGGDSVLGGLRVDKNRDDSAQRFKPVVLFNAPARSDEAGFAKLKFKMPSYMGSVRVMVVANENDAYGSVSKDIQVSAPLVMLETLPRTLKIGDNFTLLTQIFKTENRIKNATLSVRSKNSLIKISPDTQTIDFKSATNLEVMMDANVSDNRIGKELLEFELKSEDYTYKNEIEIDIKPINAYTYENNTSLIKAGESKEFIIKDYILGTTNATLKLSPTPILDMDKRIKYLLNYPYGCIEQTTSAVLPQLFLDKFSTEFDKQKAINNINAAIERYSNFQTADGGFAYWQGGDESNAWGSNYAGMFLILAKQNGYFVPDSMYERWLKYEQNFVQKSVYRDYMMDIKANSLYLLAMAKKPNISEMNLLYDNLNTLSTEAKWQLAAAYKLAGVEDTAKQIASKISIEPDSKYSFYTYGSLVRDEAIIANAYKQIYGTNNEELLQKISDTLLSKDYLSTQSTGYALYALAMGANLENMNENFMDATLKIDDQAYTINQNQMQIFSFNDEKAIVSANKDIFVSFGVEGVKASENPAFNNKISLDRAFYDEKGNKISPSEIGSGQTFYMRISVSLNEGANYVSNIALTQILPSGWEVSNTLLDDNTPSFIKNSNYDFIDVRDDKIMWFFGLNKNRTHHFYIKLNAITPGSYTLSGAYAEAMYDDTYRALSESEKVVVKR
ncbi:alpha-2-macroglobulin family protein [Campylobacter coli]|uniref:alpha-2-macroglobulin family protein n=1 Tax=Campylobacter coli TaxID=195 RepID=UPI0011A49BCD|nr:MG2 domain-containing protein [Campylobacter coli]